MSETTTNAADVFERDPALDGIRRLALSMVMIGHLGLAPVGAVTRAVYTIVDSFQIGLVLFFVLSGFLISAWASDAQRTISIRASC